MRASLREVRSHAWLTEHGHSLVPESESVASLLEEPDLQELNDALHVCERSESPWTKVRDSASVLTHFKTRVAQKRVAAELLMFEGVGVSEELSLLSKTAVRPDQGEKSHLANTFHV